MDGGSDSPIDDDDLLAAYASPAGGSSAGWTPRGGGGGSSSGWTPGGGSVPGGGGSGAGWTPGGASGASGGGGSSRRAKKEKASKQRQPRDAPGGGLSGGLSGAGGLASGGGSSYREAQRAAQRSRGSATAAVSAKSVAQAEASAGARARGREAARTGAPLQTAEDLAAELGIDMDEPEPEPEPAPRRNPNQHVHFGIGALEAMEDPPTPGEESYGDDFEISGDNSSAMGSISLEAVSEESAPAPAPRSNVHFGIAALETIDVPEPAPAPVRAPAPAPAPRAHSGSNVHFGIAGLEEMSDGAISDQVEEVGGGSGSNVASISMDSLQELASGDLDESVDIVEESADDDTDNKPSRANVHFGIGGLTAASSDGGSVRGSAELSESVASAGGVVGSVEDEDEEYYSSEFERSMDVSGASERKLRHSTSDDDIAPAPAHAPAHAPVPAPRQARRAAGSQPAAFSPVPKQAIGWENKPLSTWSVDEAADWLEGAMRLPDAAMLAKSVGVDGLLLGVMTEPELQLELGAAPGPACRCYAACLGISELAHVVCATRCGAAVCAEEAAGASGHAACAGRLLPFRLGRPHRRGPRTGRLG